MVLLESYGNKYQVVLSESADVINTRTLKRIRWYYRSQLRLRVSSGIANEKVLPEKGGGYNLQFVLPISGGVTEVKGYCHSQVVLP